jgi:hypothetical protein
MTRLWWKLSADIFSVNLAAQRVIGLRLAKLAKGGPAANRESRRMVAEKIGASTEAMVALATGGSIQSIVQRTGAIVRANERRLTKARR